MKKTNFLLNGSIGAAVIALLFFIGSCKKENQDPSSGGDNSAAQRVNLTNEFSEGCVYIYAGQNINVGSLCMEDIDTDNNGVDDALRICVTTGGCWEVTGVASWYGCATCMPPTNKAGNPIPGQFPYQSGSIATQSYCYTVPFSTLGFSCPGGSGSYRGAVHLNVHNTCTGATETGWAAGNRINSKGNWGTFFGFTITCDEVPPPPPNTCDETAFGQDNSASTCFTSATIDNLLGENPDINRWGWTNGAYSGDGSHTLTLRAGAAQCGAGTVVGTATVTRTGSTITFSYNVNSPYSLGQVHFYAGNTMLPVITNGCPNSPQCGDYTVAPGQYPYVGSVYPANTTTTGTITYPVSVTGDYYVVAHAAVSGFPCEDGN